MLSFLAVGDWGRRGCPEQRAVAQGMVRAARRLRSRFVVSTGDNFYEEGVTGLGDPHWQESYEAVYAEPALRTPWHPVLGNHDYRGSVDAQIAYTQRSNRWRLPARYYTLKRPIGEGGQRVQLFFLDTSPFLPAYRPGGKEHTPNVESQDPEAQLAWLSGELAASEATWKLVVAHHPARSGSPFHGNAPVLDERIGPVLREGGVDLYLSGHEHDLQHLVDEHGMHHVVTGAGSECRATGACAATRFSRGALGFASFSVRARSLRVRLHDAEGHVIHRALVEKAPARNRPLARKGAGERQAQP